MPLFCIGDQVLIRRGDRAGQRAEVVQTQRAEVYKVKMRDDSFLFCSERQLEGIHRQAQTRV